MNALLDTLFGLDGIGFGADGVRLELARAIPAWIWAVAIPLAIALAAASYARVRGNRRILAALAVARSLTILLLLLLLAGPQLIRPNERIEPDRVLLLADRSASMLIPDAGPPAQRRPRDDQLRDSYEQLTSALGPPSEERVIDHIGFAAGTFELPPSAPSDSPGSTAADLGEPTGSRTLLGRSLSESLRRTLGRPVAGVVILSDGRSFDDIPPDALRRLTDDRIPVFAAALGSEQRVPDLAIERLTAPALAFTKDRVPVTIDLAAPAESGARVELIDDDTGRSLAAQRLQPGDESVTLPIDSPGVGRRSITARITPDGEDLLDSNNQRTLRLEFVDRPVRVLYIEGYPRWEYRYLKNLLVREDSVRASTLLLSNRFEYIQEGDAPIEALPDSPEAWAPFDVVILGDIRPELLGEARLAQLREHIATRGAGLVWIGGTGPTPTAWATTVLAPLLPISLDRAAEIAIYDEPVTIRREPPAARQGLLGLDEAGAWPDRLTDPTTGWSLLHGAQRIEPTSVKPTASVLASALPSGDDSAATPALIEMRYGAGRVLYTAFDETWRWRYARGEALTERFWIPLVRSFGREALARHAGGALLRVSPPRVEVGSPVRFELIVNDQSVLERRPPAIRAELVRTGDEPTAIRLNAEQLGADTFSTSTVLSEPGAYELRLDDPLLTSDASATFEVVAPQDELRNPEADHQRLAALAEQTGGLLVEPEQIASIVERLPNRARRIPTAPDIATLWDRPIVLITLLGLLLAEWLGRRAMRLI